MNEILAVIVICLSSELIFDSDTKKSEFIEADDEELACDEIHEAYVYLHNPKYIWSDAYSMFERIMNLGVKELYYKEIKASPVED
jgi:hypothetical protein